MGVPEKLILREYLGQQAKFTTELVQRAELAALLPTAFTKESQSVEA